MLQIKGFIEITKCKICGEEIKDTDFIHIKKYGCVCEDCYSGENHSYSEPNKNIKYKPRKDKRTVSFEFETGEKSPELALLYKYGFIPCPDGSIEGCEWKSPIFQNLIGVSHILKELNQFAQFVDEDCGTHIHVGTVNGDLKDFLSKDGVRKKIFNKTYHLYNNAEGIMNLFGRTPEHYCQASIIHDRYEAINVFSSKPTIEFRLPKFYNNEQYLLCIKYAIDFVNILEKDFNKNKDVYEWGGKKAIKFSEQLGNKLSDLTKGYIQQAKSI